MKSQAMVLVLLLCLSLFPLESSLQGEEITLSSQVNAQVSVPTPNNDVPIVSTYSQAVKSSLARVSDLSQYSDETLSNVTAWVAIGRIPVGLELPQLEGAWLMELGTNGKYIVEGMQEEGIIEAAYPLLEYQQIPRWVPNDPKFSDQWHLDNTGQSGGTVGEDANLSGAWNSYQ